jgi:hypothetical protein
MARAGQAKSYSTSSMRALSSPESTRSPAAGCAACLDITVAGHRLSRCVRPGELDRAEAEGGKALATTRTTGSTGATRELKRLATALA